MITFRPRRPDPVAEQSGAPVNAEAVDALMRGILLRDTATPLGIFAAGVDVLVLVVHGDDALVCLSTIGARKITAVVPKVHVAVRGRALGIKAVAC